MTERLGVTGVFLDPPYTKESGRQENLYALDDLTVGHQVRDWAVENGGNPNSGSPFVVTQRSTGCQKTGLNSNGKLRAAVMETKNESGSAALPELKSGSVLLVPHGPEEPREVLT